ncbi:MAG: outer membrane lipid asymmetry maintenance protein MlaD [Alphaproteobacteria bacterium]|nr:outer membrane lipid asymmetry maintenance protein MlaD [Alphaproteobacteria bacterium]
MGGNLVETLIGAAVLVVAGIFLAFGYSTSSIGSDGGFMLIAKFDRVDGLTTGSDVRMSGIKVGTVIAQRLDQETYQAVIEMDIKQGIPLPDDSSAKITSEGLLGATYLSLDAGGSEDFLENGSEIRFTQGSIDLMSLIGQAIFSATGNTEEKK